MFLNLARFELLRNKLFEKKQRMSKTETETERERAESFSRYVFMIK